VDWVLKYLVLSDIHANIEALDAALNAAGRYDHALVLGDLVGYGADPNAVIDRLRALSAATFIRGNHDKVGAGLENTDGFNYLARQAISWTANTLTPDHRQWLAALAQGPVVIDDLVEICHGAPFDEDVYIFDDLDAMRALHVARRPLCLFGHTHVVAAFYVTGEMRTVGVLHAAQIEIPRDDHSRFLVNCGAVGQPRDGDPRAAYGILDTETRTLSLQRIEYDVAAAQAKILAAGLPDVLAQRLTVGR
jgi:diadenosine tetraphosphatase ApaH/serine/threonine PP2A family protein phosphatase